MKQLLTIGIILAFVMGACSQHDDNLAETRQGRSLPTVASSELSAIDSLMWRQPDNALKRLIPYFDNCCEDVSGEAYNRHYAHLLLAELLYKNDYAQTNRTELLHAVGHFDSLCCEDVSGNVSTLAFLDARAHYINGVGYYETDSVVQACKEYLKALEVMEGHFEEKELIGNKAKFMALTYAHLTKLFSDLYLHEQAIYFGKLSQHYFQIQESSSWHLSWALNEIGSHFDIMNELDSAEYYYKQAKAVLNDTNSILYRDITTRQAYLEYNKGTMQAEASILCLMHVLSESVNETERLARCLVIGEIYYNEKLFDSAWAYLEPVYNRSTSLDGKMQTAERLQEISIYYGDTIHAKEYAMYRTQYAIKKDQHGKLISTLTTLGQEYEKNRKESEHRLRVEKAKRHWGILLGTSVMVIAVACLFLMKGRKQKKLLKQQLENEEYSHMIEQKSLSGRLKKTNTTLHEVSKQLELTLSNSIQSEPEQSDDYAAFINSPICLQIVKFVHEGQFKSKMDYQIYKDASLSKEQILDLRNAAKKHLTRFSSHIRKQFPTLTDNDLDYCYLYLLGLTEADVSALMQRAYSTVCDRNRKIRRILGTNESLYHTLCNMIFE